MATNIWFVRVHQSSPICTHKLFFKACQTKNKFLCSFFCVGIISREERKKKAEKYFLSLFFYTTNKIFIFIKQSINFRILNIFFSSIYILSPFSPIYSEQMIENALSQSLQRFCCVVKFFFFCSHSTVQ
jgi:hypothetical protein